ncbi:hypothetical protein FSARC_709 [Fusarium sarcochroum]|uniref:DUF6546 domain-containing protein n=1 Tax=Fusarium sarcochroum TaxID=1208366 RepID=A0A8H4UAS8_9HYPO|nr:hypothetical protein FSARC_709 [Fusarium sarcochroum]
MTASPLPTIDKTRWDYLPAEVRLLILECLLQDGCSLARLATVSREWQGVMEQHNFARIKLTPSRLGDLNHMTSGKRSLVHYLWFCFELEKYDCNGCASVDNDTWEIGGSDITLILKAIENLFSALSVWKPSGDLVLDIGVHSPSDSEHWFKYLTFGPDVPLDERSRSRCIEQAQVDDVRHEWLRGRRIIAPEKYAICRVTSTVMGDEEFFESQEEETQWWQQLPLIPAVTGFLLRQQNHRQWAPIALKHMFTHFPGLKEIHYEPWREWTKYLQFDTDKAYQLLFESLTSYNIRKLVIFENFNEYYLSSLKFHDCDRIRIPNPNISRVIASASLGLEELSASFIVDASYFLNACQTSWLWPNLTSIVLTSRLLTPLKSRASINSMLVAAAAAAENMPKLKTMEIWNGRKGLAMLFSYQSGSGCGRNPAVVTCRGTWELVLHSTVTRAWEAVAVKHRYVGPVFVKELLGDATAVKSHGDAIHHLKLSGSVIRPVSLQQIQMEHQVMEGV